MPAKPPLPPHYQRFDAEMVRHSSSIPPRTKEAITDRDIKVNADMVAMGEAFNRGMRSLGDQVVQVVAEVKSSRQQIAAADGRIIALHAWATRNPWLHSPVTRLLATFLGAAAGSYAAMKGFK